MSLLLPWQQYKGGAMARLYDHLGLKECERDLKRRKNIAPERLVRNCKCPSQGHRDLGGVDPGVLSNI